MKALPSKFLIVVVLFFFFLVFDSQIINNRETCRSKGLNIHCWLWFPWWVKVDPMLGIQKYQRCIVIYCQVMQIWCWTWKRSLKIHGQPLHKTRVVENWARDKEWQFLGFIVTVKWGTFFFFWCRVGVWMNREIRISGGVRDDVVVWIWIFLETKFWDGEV